MSAELDVNRIVRSWIRAEEHDSADRVLQIVLSRLDTTPQRRHLWSPRRFFHVNKLAPAAIAATAAIVVAVLGYNLLPGTGVGGRSTPTPTDTPTAPQTAAPSPIGSPMAITDSVLAGGRYRFQPLSEVPSLSIVAEIPSGWHGEPSWAVTGPGNGSDPPSGIGVAFIGAAGLFSDPCHWDLDGSRDSGQPGDVVVGPAVIDLVEALRANTSYTSSTPSRVTFGEFQGYELELQLAPDTSNCDKDEEGSARYYVFSGPDGGLYEQGDSRAPRWHLFIVDVDGTRVITVVAYYDGTPAAEQQAAEAIVDSLVFTP